MTYTKAGYCFIFAGGFSYLACWLGVVFAVDLLATLGMAAFGIFMTLAIFSMAMARWKQSQELSAERRRRALGIWTGR